MQIIKKYLIIFLLILFIEVFIALFVRDQFIRPFIGDVLVTVLLFAFCRIFYNGNALKLALGVLIFSFTIEFLQYLKLIEILGLQNNKIAVTVLGATFDWLDLLAYLLGVLISYFIDKKLNTPKN
ncbi:hypothetical protein BXQ17_06095 [Polaribacter sp. BM10]|uniref:ribosomal maturation YjgA family protein n=1 Tax=Polaribacter sp. BM10 TaxID=1529069 RepID=UPI000989EF71|nr:DUF2809 domain-containing protein [Polaribacter sp. BM10]AQS93651.1 hypothetical protein BXQ17_06095 [Polaribacter sp. BM10]